jgi:hypothetical protein
MAAGDVADGRGHDADRKAVRETDGREVGALRRDDRPCTDEDQREGPDELSETSLQERLSWHAKNPRSRVGPRRSGADVLRGVSLRNERRLMSADILKRKIRNFPVANLNIRIAAAH